MSPRLDPRAVGEDSAFEDREDLLPLARLLAEGAPEPPQPEAFFRGQLRRQVMKAAAERPRRGFLRGLLGLDTGGWAPRLAVVAAVAGAGLILWGANRTTLLQGTANVAFVSPLQHATSVATGRAIPIQFAQAMNHPSVEHALRIEPATSYHTVWQGNVLYIVPLNGLAPDTDYQITIGTTATTAGGAYLLTPIVLTFSTAPPPPAATVPVTPAQLGLSGEHPLDGSQGGEPQWAGETQVAWLDTPPGQTSGKLYLGLATGESAGQLLDSGVVALATRGSRVAWVDRVPSPVPVAAPNPVTSSLPALPSALPSVTAQAAPGAANVFEAHLLQNGVSADLGPVTAPWIAWLSDQELVGIRADGAWGLQQNATSRLAAFNPSAYAGYSLQPTGRYLAAMTSGGDIAWYDLSVSTSTPAAPSPAPTAAAGFDCGLGSGPTPSPSVAVPAGPSLSWSADGGWAALALGAELWRVDAGGGATRKLADAGEGVAISGVAVSPDGQLVLFQESGCDQPPRLWLVSADGTGQRRIGASLPYSQLAWSPSGDRVAFARSGQVWLAQVSYGSLTQEQDDLAGARVALDAFMSARVAANPDQAGNYLSAAGRSAYGNGLGAPVGESFSRYTVIASQVTYDVHLDPSGHPSSSTPSVVAEVHELVRLVTSRVGLAHGTILEDVLVARIGDGYLVDGVTQDQEEPVDQSPQVNALTLEPRSSSSTQRRIDVAFDGELDPTSVQPQGFTVVDAGGQTLPTEVAYDSSTRTVSVTFDSPAAGPYVLQVQGVRDVNGAHTANLFSWRFSIFAAR